MQVEIGLVENKAKMKGRRQIRVVSLLYMNLRPESSRVAVRPSTAPQDAEK